MSVALAVVLFFFPMVALGYFLLRALFRAVALASLAENQRNALNRQAIALGVQILAVLPVVLLGLTPMPFREAAFPFSPLLLLPLAYMGVSSMRHCVSIGGGPFGIGKREGPFLVGRTAQIGGGLTLLAIAAGSAAILVLSLA